MPKTEPLVPLLDALNDLVAWFQAAHVSGVVIGGVAASLLGRPRVTRDVDAMVFVSEAEWAGFLSLGAKFGFVPRRADAIEFAKMARVLLVQHGASGIDVDVVFGALPFEEEALARAVQVEIRGIRVPLPSPEDLIIMKAVAHRPRDLADIESVMDAHPTLDIGRIRRWVREFANALEMPDIFDDTNKILNLHEARKGEK